MPGDKGAAAGDDLDQPLAGQYPDGFAGGQPRDLVALHQLGFGRYGPAGRIDAAADLVAQDRRYLQVERRLALMINRHPIKVADQRGRKTVLSDPSPAYPARRSVAAPVRKRPRTVRKHRSPGADRKAGPAMHDDPTAQPSPSNPAIEAIVTVASAVTDLVEVAEMLPVPASEAERVAKILDRLSEELAEAAGLLRKASARDERFMP
jgi:hypothetical protein